MSKLITLLAIFAIALTGCTTAANTPEPAETGAATASINPHAIVKYDKDDDGYIDFVVKTTNGCVTSVELFNVAGEPTGYKLEQPEGAPCMDEATGIDTLMAFINETGGL